MFWNVPTPPTPVTLTASCSPARSIVPSPVISHPVLRFGYFWAIICNFSGDIERLMLFTYPFDSPHSLSNLAWPMPKCAKNKSSRPFTVVWFPCMLRNSSDISSLITRAKVSIVLIFTSAPLRAWSNVARVKPHFSAISTLLRPLSLTADTSTLMFIFQYYLSLPTGIMYKIMYNLFGCMYNKLYFCTVKPQLKRN